MMFLVRGWPTWSKYFLSGIEGCTTEELEEDLNPVLARFHLMVIVIQTDDHGRPTEIFFARCATQAAP